MWLAPHPNQMQLHVDYILSPTERCWHLSCQVIAGTYGSMAASDTRRGAGSKKHELAAKVLSDQTLRRQAKAGDLGLPLTCTWATPTWRCGLRPPNAQQTELMQADARSSNSSPTLQPLLVVRGEFDDTKMNGLYIYTI